MLCFLEDRWMLSPLDDDKILEIPEFWLPETGWKINKINFVKMFFNLDILFLKL